jgi:hypothetical protein
LYAWLQKLKASSALQDKTTMKTTVRLILVSLASAVLMASTGWGQWPYAPPAPPVAPPPLPPSAPYPQQTPVAPQPAPPRAQQPQHQQSQRQEYAFRPDLTNPQYGSCLGLEKSWKSLWQQYAQGYQQAQSLQPQDPRYAQMSYYLSDLKRRMDAAWHQFSSECIYFPANRR